MASWFICRSLRLDTSAVCWIEHQSRWSPSSKRTKNLEHISEKKGLTGSKTDDFADTTHGMGICDYFSSNERCRRSGGTTKCGVFSARSPRAPFLGKVRNGTAKIGHVVSRSWIWWGVSDQWGKGNLVLLCRMLQIIIIDTPSLLRRTDTR